MQDDDMKDIKAKLERVEAPVPEECCIYKVPIDIRKLNEDAYTPTIVSIGPFHHNGHPHLQNMERYKLLFCRTFLERTQTTLDSWISYIKEEVPNFRRCYSDTLEFSEKELVELILVDSCFILELLWRSYNNEWSGDASFLSKTQLEGTIRQDLLLLENQLPFYLLDSLYNFSFSKRSESDHRFVFPSFRELTFRYFSHLNTSKLDFHGINIRHFTDLIRTFHLQHPPERRPGRSFEPLTYFPSNTWLAEAGMKFKVNTESNCVLDFKFSGQILEIPPLLVHNSSEVVLRNMLALELCHYPFESYITDVVFVWDFLINTGKDVEILVGNRTLVHWLGDSDSVAKLFNSLGKNLMLPGCSSHFLDLSKGLNAFCEDPWRKRKATLKRDYCNTPWQTAASIAGILLLILSLVQSVCSVLQVIQQIMPPHPQTLSNFFSYC